MVLAHNLALSKRGKKKFKFVVFSHPKHCGNTFLRSYHQNIGIRHAGDDQLINKCDKSNSGAVLGVMENEGSHKNRV